MKTRINRGTAMVTLFAAMAVMVLICMVELREIKATCAGLSQPASSTLTENSGVMSGDTQITTKDGNETTASTGTETTATTTTTTTQTTTTTTTTTATTATATTAAAQDTAASGQAAITNRYANVRSDAGSGSELIGKVYFGEEYTYTATKYAPNGVLWLKIQLSDGSSGYICASFTNYAGMVEGGRAYLTFDDGPSDNTSRILDILDEYGVKATFFVINHKGYDNTYKRIAEEGHTLALHSWSHDYSAIYSSTDAFWSDISRLSDKVEQLTGIRSNLMRFPGGSSNTVSEKYKVGVMTELTRQAGEKGYRYFDWNVNSGDADKAKASADEIFDNVQNRLGSKRDVIILMHDAASKATTVEALPRIIELLRLCGYSILPLDYDSPTAHQRVAN